MGISIKRKKLKEASNKRNFAKYCQTSTLEEVVVTSENIGSSSASTSICSRFNFPENAEVSTSTSSTTLISNESFPGDFGSANNSELGVGTDITNVVQDNIIQALPERRFSNIQACRHLSL